MKVILASILMTCIFTESYSFVSLARENKSKQVKLTDDISIEAESKPDPTTTPSYTENIVLDAFPLAEVKSKKLHSYLCTDEKGYPIFGATEYKHDCRKFVNCGYQTATIMHCGAGLLFNKMLDFCDWPSKAKCFEFRGKHTPQLVIPANEVVW